jgi:hypothetical protein
MKVIHKVCSMLRKHEALSMSRKKAVEHGRCKECPAWVKTSYGAGKQGCRALAEEMVNIVHFGNPWGRKYRYSRRSWPDRSRYAPSGNPK